MTRPTDGKDRIKVVPAQARGKWVLADRQGRLHSAVLKDKARAQRQADQMNARLDSIGRLAKEGE